MHRPRRCRRTKEHASAAEKAATAAACAAARAKEAIAEDEEIVWMLRYPPAEESREGASGAQVSKLSGEAKALAEECARTAAEGDLLEH